MEAVELSRRRGVPVRVQWTRECDLGYDYFHAASAQYFKAEIDNDGMPSAWLQRTAFPTIMSLFAPGAEQPALGNWKWVFQTCHINSPINGWNLQESGQE